LSNPCPVLFNPDFVWSIPIYGQTVNFVSYDPTTYVMEVSYTNGNTILIGTVGITATNAIAVAANPEEVVLNLVATSTQVGFPINTAAPFITGTPTHGHTLYVNNGSWCYSPTSFTYQWIRGLTPVSGATSQFYTVSVADIGFTLSAQVVAINQYGSSAAVTTASVGPVT